MRVPLPTPSFTGTRRRPFFAPGVDDIHERVLLAS